MTRRPSVTGDGVHEGLSGGVCSGPVQVGPACQSNSPVRLFKHITVRWFSMACVMKICSFQTIGVELPRSGSATRQRTFSFVLQRNGRFVSRQIPLPSAPRHAGQLPASAGEVRSEINNAAAAYVFKASQQLRSLSGKCCRAEKSIFFCLTASSIAYQLQNHQCCFAVNAGGGSNGNVAWNARCRRVDDVDPKCPNDGTQGARRTITLISEWPLPGIESA